MCGKPSSESYITSAIIDGDLSCKGDTPSMGDISPLILEGPPTPGESCSGDLLGDMLFCNSGDLNLLAAPGVRTGEAPRVLPKLPWPPNVPTDPYFVMAERDPVLACIDEDARRLNESPNLRSAWLSMDQHILSSRLLEQPGRDAGESGEE